MRQSEKEHPLTVAPLPCPKCGAALLLAGEIVNRGGSMKWVDEWQCPVHGAIEQDVPETVANHGNQVLLRLAMSEIVFPFCLVTARQGDLSLPVTPRDGVVAAFSTVEKAASYMYRRGDTGWRMTLVSRPTFQETIASLRLVGVKGLAFDPTDEHPGRIVNFQNIE